MSGSAPASSNASIEAMRPSRAAQSRAVKPLVLAPLRLTPELANDRIVVVSPRNAARANPFGVDIIFNSCSDISAAPARNTPQRSAQPSQRTISSPRKSPSPDKAPRPLAPPATRAADRYERPADSLSRVA